MAMRLKQQLDSDIKQAMKAGDRTRVNCLRMLKSKILEKEVSLRAERGADCALNDQEAVEVIAAYAKQRRDSIEGFKQGGRDDLVAQEEQELEIVSAFLPEQLGEEDIRGIVREAITESGASSAREMGAVMKLVMPRVKGAADGKLVSRIARELLESS
jgi:uncharacterized protein YqeY